MHRVIVGGGTLLLLCPLLAAVPTAGRAEGFLDAYAGASFPRDSAFTIRGGGVAASGSTQWKTASRRGAAWAFTSTASPGLASR
jgi:hypothetical protein